MRSRQRLSVITTFVLAALATRPASAAPPTSSPAASLPAAAAHLFPPDLLRADLDFLLRTIEESHPNMYAYVSRDDFAKVRDAALARLDRPMTRREFFLVTAPVVAALRNGHTYVAFPFDDYRRHILDGGLTFPLTVARDDDTGDIVLLDCPSHPHLRGATLLTINHRPAADLLSAIARWHAAERKDANGSVLPRNVALHLWLAFGPLDSLPLTFRTPDGRHLSETLRPTPAGAAPTTSPTRALLTTPGATYRPLPDADAALLDIATFTDPDSFRPFARDLFTHLRDHDIHNLIIDLRNCPGGNSSVGDVLLPYLTDRPLSQFPFCQIKVSPLLRKTQPGLVDFLNSPNAPFYARSPKDGQIVAFAGLPSVPQPTPLRFRGHTYVLISPKTASSAIAFAHATRTTDCATLVGQETTDSVSVFGDIGHFTLPNTNLTAGCAMKTFVDARVPAGQGVLPHHHVKTTPADLLNDRDPPLTFTLSLIRNSRPATAPAAR